MQHFEQLWEQAEVLFKPHLEQDISSSLLEELLLKVNLYRSILTSNNPAEIEILKSRAMGEILLTLANLSAKDNINVYAALYQAIQYREIKVYSEKYMTT